MGHWSTYRRRGGRWATNQEPPAPGVVTVTSVATGAGNTAVWSFSADIVQRPAELLQLGIEARGYVSVADGPADNQVTVTYDSNPIVGDDWIIQGQIPGLVFTGGATINYPQSGTIAV